MATALIARCLMAGLAALLAGLKLVGGYDPALSIPQWLYWVVALAELAASVLLFTKWRGQAMGLLLLVWLSGSILGIVLPAVRCGCLGGSVHVTREQHVGLACVLGLLACAAIKLHSVSLSSNR